MPPNLDTSLIQKLSKEQEDLVLKEINYSRQQLQADLKHIRTWLNDQQHLPASRLSETDSFLESYLIGSKGSLETVKKKLDSYYTVRSYSEIFDCRDPLEPIYETFCKTFDLTAGPGVAPNGVHLFIGRFSELDVDKFDHLSSARYIVNRCEVHLRLCGYACRLFLVVDCRGVPPSIALKLKPTIVRDLLFLMQEVLPLRVYKFCYINTPPVMEKLVNTLIKPFLSKKLRERLYITTRDYEDLLKYFSPSALPSDYGGDSTNPTLTELRDKWNKNEQQNRDWFMNELSERTDESKRIVIDNNTSKNSYFGVHGSLKKLEID